MMIDEIKREVHALLEKKIGDHCYNKITNISKNKKWCDAIAAQGCENSHIVGIKPDDKISTYISSRLAHIIVNPSYRKNDTTALVEAYVYAENNCNAVNHSADIVQSFLESLCIVSDRNKTAFLASNETDRMYYTNKESIRLLVGDRGVGKTFFLNHVLAKYSSYLDDKKIIWVRLNLVDTFGANNDLLWWMYAQASKIILRYYCKESKYFDRTSSKIPIEVLPFVRSWIESIESESHKVVINEALQELIDVFITNSTDEPITPALLPKGLARKIWESAIRIGGYSFIIVFDGMDRLESSTDSHKKFSELVSGLRKLEDSTEAVPASFVVACRRKTADRLASANAFPFASFSVEKHMIGEVCFEDVFDRRLNYLDRRIKDFLMTSSDGYVSTEEINLKKFREYIAKDKHEFSMFGKNMRATMQAVQLRHKEFLACGDDFDTHDYRWVESCVKMGWKFPPKVYAYKSSDDPIMPYICNTRESTYDNRLLVSVFSYPYFEFEDNPKISPNFENCLIGLRILQLAQTSCALFESKTIKSRITVEFLSEILKDCFSYPGKLTRAALREFAEFELIDTESDQLIDSNIPIQNAEVRITQKGRYVLNHCLSDVAYLAMCAMRIPMDMNILITDDESPPFFHAYAFRSNRRGVTSSGDLGRWVRTKAVNSLNLFKLLEHLDSIQISHLTSKLPSIISDYTSSGRGKTWMSIILAKFNTNLTPLSTHKLAIQFQVNAMLESVVSIGDSGEQIVSLLESNRDTWWDQH